MKIYISGPMTGMANYNRPAFEKAAIELSAMGYEPIQPAKSDRIRTRAECLKDDIKLLIDCEGIYMLDGWEYSAGAKLELAIAKELGIKEMYY